MLTVREISIRTAMLEDHVYNDIMELVNEDKIILFELTKENYLIHRENYNSLKDAILNELDEFHKKYPLRAGKSKEEIRSKYLSKSNSRTGERFLDLLIEEGFIVQKGEYLSLSDFEINYNSEQLEIKDEIINIYKNNKYNPVKKRDSLSGINREPQEIEEVFISLIGEGILLNLGEDIYIFVDYYNEAIDKLKAYLSENESINIGEFRDLLETNRKMAIGLLEYFDKAKITKRDGDNRILAE